MTCFGLSLCTSTLLLGFLVILVLCLLFRRRHNPKCPPCPISPWPVLGHMLLLDENPREQFMKFREKCGDLFTLYLGMTQVTVLNGLDVVKEVYLKRGDEFSDRAVIFMNVALGGSNIGIVGGNGDVWKENRGLTMNILKSFGFGKNILVEMIQEELHHYIDRLKSFGGKATDIRLITMVSVSNIMCALIVGKRFDYGNTRFMRIVEILNYNLSQIRGTAILNFFPSLRHLPGDIFKFKIIERNFREFLDVFAMNYFHKFENFDGEPENYIAAYMQEIRKQELAGKKTHINRSNLIRCIFDIFAGGTETSSNTLLWIMLYMLHHPETQEKIYQEIDSVIGPTRLPNMNDKAKLVFTNAAIMEVQRLANLVPLGLPREVLKDTTLRGFFLPKGSQIMSNNDCLLRDKATWGPDADKFRPERFIAEDGSLSCPEAWTPFSLGRRVCPGEGMAKMELFLFITNIMQKFHLLPEDPNNIPPLKENFGITRTPAPFKIRLVSRKS